MNMWRWIRLVATGLLLAAATATPLLLAQSWSGARADARDTVRVGVWEEPAVPDVAMPDLPYEPLVAPVLRPRPWPFPAFEPPPMRGVLAAGVLIPPSPPPVDAPVPPLVRDVPVFEPPIVAPRTSPAISGPPSLVRRDRCCGSRPVRSLRRCRTPTG